MKWSQTLGSNQVDDRIVKLKRAFATPACTKVCTPDLERWTYAFRRNLLTKACSAVRHAYLPSLSNMFPLLRLALRLLRDIDFVAVPNDKGPGYAFVTATAFRSMEANIAEKSCYVRVRPCDIPERQNKEAAAAAARRVETHIGLSGAARTLNRSLARGTFLAKLGLQVKTHKAPGDVGVRNLHCCSDFPLEGLARWLTETFVAAVPSQHLLRDSIQARDHIHGMQVTVDAKLATLDIKDFFMSGDAHQLLADCTDAFVGAIRTLVSEVLCLLLDSQYVVLQSDPACMYKVVEGSGMGLLFSGSVATLSFYRRGEVKLVNPSSMTRHCVSCYRRYHDDIICVYQDSCLFMDFVRQMRYLADYFKVICTEVSQHQIRYLDLKITKVKTHLEVIPALEKPIIPLAPESGHAKFVHWAWPHAVASRFKRLAGPRANSCAILNYYSSNNAAPWTQRVLESALTSSPSPRPKGVVDPGHTVWLKVTSHPLWNAMLPSWISQMQPPASVDSRVRIAWRNHHKSLAHIIRVHNKNLLGR